MPEYFTLPELRELPQVGDSSKYPDSRCESVAAAVVTTIDGEVFGSSAVGFVPRTVTETLDGNGRGALVLRTPYVRSLTSVTVDGVAVTVGDLVANGGILRYADAGPTWPVGRQNVVVTYSAAYGTGSTPPPDIKEAALQLTRYRLLAGAATSEVSARALSRSDDGGTINFATAGADRPTGYPDVDAVVIRYRDRIAGGFA